MTNEQRFRYCMDRAGIAIKRVQAAKKKDRAPHAMKFASWMTVGMRYRASHLSEEAPQ